MTYLLAALVGLSLGVLGSGGSVLAVPILKYAAGLTAREAVATSLATVGAVAAVGAALAWREGRVMWKEGLLFSLVAAVGTVVGVELAKGMAEVLQMGIFILVMAYAAMRMFQQESPEPPDKKQAMGPGQATAKALAVGLLTGIVGVGGGFLIVPALVALFKLPMKKATGTSLLVIAVNSAVGTARYAGAIELNWGFTGAFVMAALVGLALGMGLSRHIEESKLKKMFAWTLVLVCLYTLAQELLALSV